MDHSVYGMIFDILRCGTDDGPGVRTTVFFKGCPLRCRWCHNPESQSFLPQLSFDFEKCVSCGRCAAVCSCHGIQDGRHTVNFGKCVSCGKCVPVCPMNALEIKGKRSSVEDVMRIVRRDVPYYNRSGGGVTFSGGEPFAQADFLRALLSCCKEEKINTAVETGGFFPASVLPSILPLVDLFLWDYKVTEDSLYWTGADREAILQNMRYVCGHGGKVRLRCPVIPGVNDNETHMAAIAALAREYALTGVDILPYHNMGVYKSEKLGREPWDRGMANMTPARKEQVREMLEKARCPDFVIL